MSGYYRSILSVLSPAVDPDAQAFITAAAITDPTQQSAINTLVLDLKTNNIWTKMKAIYPFIGGSATPHTWDLKRLVQGTFFGGWTHSSNGAKGNGTTGYFNANISPSTDLSKDSNSIGYYNRLSTPNQGYSGVGTPNWFIIGDYTNTQYYPNANAFIEESSGLISPIKTWIGTRRSGTDVELYYDGSSVKTGSISSLNLPSDNFWIGGINNGGSLGFPTNMEFSFFFSGDGLSDTDSLNLTTAINTFQITLSRNV